jgi:hypothetical protein
MYSIHILVHLGMHCFPSVVHGMLLIQTIWEKNTKKEENKL